MHAYLPADGSGSHPMALHVGLPKPLAAGLCAHAPHPSPFVPRARPCLRAVLPSSARGLGCGTRELPTHPGCWRELACFRSCCCTPCWHQHRVAQCSLLHWHRSRWSDCCRECGGLECDGSAVCACRKCNSMRAVISAAVRCKLSRIGLQWCGGMGAAGHLRQHIQLYLHSRTTDRRPLRSMPDRWRSSFCGRPSSIPLLYPA